jgi:hypothetical protein
LDRLAAETRVDRKILDLPQQEALDRFLPEAGFGVVRLPSRGETWITAPIVTQRFPLSASLLDIWEAARGTGLLLREEILGSSGLASSSDSAEPFVDYRIEEESLVATDTRPILAQVGAILSNLERSEARSEKAIQPDEGFEAGDLEARSFVVVSAEDRVGTAPDATHRRRLQLKLTQQVLESVLYGVEGIEAAAAQGRSMVANSEDGTLHVIDTPENLAKVEAYLRPASGGPGGSRGSGSNYRFHTPRHRTAQDLGNAVRGLFLNVR